MDAKCESIATKHENKPNESQESSESSDMHQRDCDNKWRYDNCDKVYFDAPEDAWKQFFVFVLKIGAYDCVITPAHSPDQSCAHATLFETSSS